jgi:transporter family protein
MNLAGIVIGGIVPAICLRLGTVLMRASIGAGATIAVFLASVGTIIAFVGWIWTASDSVSGSTLPSIAFAVAMGLVWTIAISCIAYGFGTLKLPVSSLRRSPTAMQSSRPCWVA